MESPEALSTESPEVPDTLRASTDCLPLAIPVSYDELGSRTWVQLREAVYLAEIALSGMVTHIPDAAEALHAMEAILDPDWDGM